jgi:hypothetical protein
VLSPCIFLLPTAAPINGMRTLVPWYTACPAGGQRLSRHATVASPLHATMGPHVSTVRVSLGYLSAAARYTTPQTGREGRHCTGFSGGWNYPHAEGTRPTGENARLPPIAASFILGLETSTPAFSWPLDSILRLWYTAHMYSICKEGNDVHALGCLCRPWAALYWSPA